MNTKKTAKIRKTVYSGNGSGGPDMVYVVDLFEGTKLMESRTLLGKSIHYAEDVAENWETGIIKLNKTSSS
jgi:hypothetical protein